MANLSIGDLTSRVVRSQIGKRIIKSGTITNSQGNIVSQITSAIFNAAGFLVTSVLKIFQFSWSALWGLIVSTTSFLFNFNWQVSDQQLDEQIKQGLQALAGEAGATLGNALGYVACGIVPGAVVMAFNEPLGNYIINNVLEEGLDEFTSNLQSLVNQAFNIGTRATLSWLYKNARKFIKNNNKLVRSLLGQGSNEKLKKMIDSWGEPSQKPWSFALQHEENIENISNPILRDFAEEFYEELGEACIEAGYVVANSLDSWIAQSMVNEQHNPTLGKVRTVEIQPNRNVPEERIIIKGNEALLKQQAVEVMVRHVQFGQRDLGMIYGTQDNMPVRSEKPEVVLKFYQAKKDRIISRDINGKTKSDPNPLTMKISFRLMDKSEDNFKDDIYVKQLAKKIYAKFANPAFKINKGKNLYTYNDWQKGYQMTLWVENQQEARKVVEQVLDIQGHKVENEKLRIGSIPITGRKTKDKKTVLGKQQEIILIGGKQGVVTFTHAYLNIGNGTNPVNLVDLTGRKRDVIYKPDL